VLEVSWERYRAQGLALISVDFKDSEQDAAAFLRRDGVTYPVGRDLTGDAAVLSGTTGIPQTFFIDRRSVIVCKFSSAISAAPLCERTQAIRKYGEREGTCERTARRRSLIAGQREGRRSDDTQGSAAQRFAAQTG
jgi:cytochrome c biogenesis protein CcmG, thiol:disulfide interchange protein DsbE